jgi:NTP pyrophosphatase (non-canonical NTP hydrolase)
MELNQYQKYALVTANKDLDERGRIANGALGLAGEAGEAADLVKKHLFHDHPLDKDKLRSELGDVLWYVATLADAVGLELDDIASQNVEKLRARYPEGFSAERSLNR